jgi:hypothetical protein
MKKASELSSGLRARESFGLIAATAAENVIANARARYDALEALLNPCPFSRKFGEGGIVLAAGAERSGMADRGFYVSSCPVGHGPTELDTILDLLEIEANT